MNKDIENQIHKLVDDKIVSHALIWWMKKSEENAREWAILKIAEFTIGTGFGFGLITWIFRKEIDELIKDTKKITKESLLKLVEIFKRFSTRRRK